jgi:hypothetical protein
MGPMPLHYLHFDLSEGDDGVSTLHALASTRDDAQHAAVLQEAQQVLDWAWQQFPHSHGPADDGMDWDHELQVLPEAGGWRTVSLTISASERFVQAWGEVFGVDE